MQLTVVCPWTDRRRGAPLSDVRAAARAFPGEPMTVRIHPDDLFSALLTDEAIFALRCRLRCRPGDPNLGRGRPAADAMSSLFGLPVVSDPGLTPGRVEVGPRAVLVGVRGPSPGAEGPAKAARTTAELLAEYAALLNRDGPDSAEARALIDAHRNDREFVELAETSRRLKAALNHPGRGQPA